MRIGMIGTGAISHKHARAYRNIGYQITVCSSMDAARGRAFAEEYGADFVERWQDVCTHPEVDFVDVCRFPGFRLEAVELCARLGKDIQVQKPIATTVEVARSIVSTAREAGILINVVSQHRFDESSQFLKRAIGAGRLGEILQGDAYVKWYRSPAYYARPEKGSWAVEGGGALINQAIHQVDLLLWLAGPVAHVSGEWKLGARHSIESEDMVSALMRYASGAIGVIQAATALWPGYPERIEIHGTRGTAIITGDKLTAWDVEDDSGEAAPVDREVASGASEPMAIALAPFERQFLDFGEAIRTRRQPLVSGEDGLRALELVEAIYSACRDNRRVTLNG